MIIVHKSVNNMTKLFVTQYLISSKWKVL